VTTSRSAAATHTAAGALLVVVAAALFGTIGTARALGPDAPALPVAAARNALACVLLAAVPLWMARRQGASRVVSIGAGIRIALRTRAVWTAALGQAAFQWCFLAAVPRVGVAVGTLVAIGLTPVVTGALSRHVDRIWVLATGIGLTGLSLLVGFGPVQDSTGLLLAVGASVTYGIYLLSGSGLAEANRRHGLSLDTALAVVFTMAAVVLMVPALATGPWMWLGTDSGAAMTVYLAVVPTLVAYHLLGAGLRSVPASTASTLGLTEPVVATALGILVLDERLSLLSAVGALLVLTAVLVLVRSTAERAP
jgi:DME family drug/metabolite transporter